MLFKVIISFILVQFISCYSDECIENCQKRGCLKENSYTSYFYSCVRNCEYTKDDCNQKQCYPQCLDNGSSGLCGRCFSQCYDSSDDCAKNHKTKIITVVVVIVICVIIYFLIALYCYRSRRDKNIQKQQLMAQAQAQMKDEMNNEMRQKNEMYNNAIIEVPQYNPQPITNEQQPCAFPAQTIIYPQQPNDIQIQIGQPVVGTIVQEPKQIEIQSVHIN